MAKQAEGFLGGFSGRLGPAVGYRWKGIWCVRSQSRFVKNPRTEAQQAHRALFKAEVQLAGKMRWALNIGLKRFSDELNMTPMNLFVKANQQAFSSEDGVFTVDYPALCVSAGPVAPVAILEASVDGAPASRRQTDNTLNISFEKNPLRRSCGAHDNVFFWVYSEELQMGYLSNPVYRRAQRASIVLPDGFLAGGTPTLHVYAFVQDEHGRCSETSYIGLEAGEMGSEVVDTETGEIVDPTANASRSHSAGKGFGTHATDGLTPTPAADPPSL